ncbi:MAG TPA: hypothetical protein VK550_31210 [Polyangiaceae bacterium]|nr:hypothetical protein [Polyangiaceae bacterium]
MNVRPATEADVPLLLQMIEDFFAIEGIPFDRTQLSPALRALLGNASLGTVWIFEQKDSVAGYATLTYGFDLEFNGRDAFLTDLYLVPAFCSPSVSTSHNSSCSQCARSKALHR